MGLGVCDWGLRLGVRGLGMSSRQVVDFTEPDPELKERFPIVKFTNGQQRTIIEAEWSVEKPVVRPLSH
jgi:hypothetical protein